MKKTTLIRYVGSGEAMREGVSGERGSMFGGGGGGVNNEGGAGKYLAWGVTRAYWSKRNK